MRQQPDRAARRLLRHRRKAAAVEALDLGGAVLPVMVKSYWKHAVAALAGRAIVRRQLRR